MPTEINLLVNGEPRSVPAGLSVEALLIYLGHKGERFAVEVNGDVVRREARALRILAADDQVEIVGFVGGG